ncbi:hypothetical protein CCE01nite_22670 [Cellulomonas cellasea]|uniref:Uncharacterized protein n=1 Tax=Cellulomonas cellasea TaxID=43670 RepID=A0A4Y3KZU5_9CELL|nr:hypothetical protein CCE01nite_22670 [Cellulomonas cellasea]
MHHDDGPVRRELDVDLDRVGALAGGGEHGLDGVLPVVHGVAAVRDGERTVGSGHGSSCADGAGHGPLPIVAHVPAGRRAASADHLAGTHGRPGAAGR